MEITSLAEKVLEAVTAQFPTNLLWVPWAGCAFSAVLGLVLMLRGAKLAPKLLALSLALLGGIAGSHLAKQFNLPFWAIVGSTAIVGLVLGFALFRFLLAGFLAACAVLGSLTAYGVNVLNVPLSQYGKSLTSDGMVKLSPADAGPVTPWTELGNVWTYLSTHADVPNFQQSFWAIVISTGVAGLMFGLLLPRAARALWAATAGVLFLGVGGYAALDRLAPQALDPLLQNPMLAWGIVGGVWLVSLVINLRSLREKKPRITVEQEAEGRPATA